MAAAENDENIEILSMLGLRYSEAKIFFALSELGESPAREISKRTGIAREFVYQTMPQLMKKGLVEEILSVPKKYKATPMEETYKLLLQRKEDENKILHSKAIQALERRKKQKPTQISDESETRLILSREAPDTRIDKEFQNVQESVDFTFPTGKFLQWSQHYAQLSLKNIRKRKLRFRIITQQKLFKILESNPRLFNNNLKSKLRNIDFRCAQNPFSVELLIFDKKTLFLSTKKQNDINKMTWLRTTNPLLLEMANGYYEAIWEKGSICKL